MLRRGRWLEVCWYGVLAALAAAAQIRLARGAEYYVAPGGVDTPIYRQAATYSGAAGRPPFPVTSPERIAARALAVADGRRSGGQVGVVAVLSVPLTHSRRSSSSLRSASSPAHSFAPLFPRKREVPPPHRSCHIVAGALIRAAPPRKREVPRLIASLCIVAGASIGSGPEQPAA